MSPGTEALRTAALIVDPQNAFSPEGELPVPGGHHIMAPLSEMIRVVRRADDRAPIVVSRDWHKDECVHFEKWPRHAVANTWSADLNPRLTLPEDWVEVRKGMNPDSDDCYSAFTAITLNGESTDDLLKRRGIGRLVIGGLATEYCVHDTVQDALRLGYNVIVIQEAIAGVDIKDGDVARAITDMEEAGARMMSLADLPLHLPHVIELGRSRGTRGTRTQKTS